VYLTIDLDVFPAAQMPGVSAPAAFGVSLENLWPLIAQVLINKHKLKLADLAELNPDFDIDSHSGRLAARLCWEIARTMSTQP
jgi:formiminoglutamase